MPVVLEPFSLDRIVSAIDDVHDRLLRATAALDAAQVDYAVIGGNAVAAWVSRVDKTVVRFTQDVDVLVRRSDMSKVVEAMAAGGFKHRHVAGIDIFLDGASTKARDAVHLLFAGELVRPEYVLPSPEVTESVRAPEYQVVSLEALMRLKLTSFRRKDQVHIQDLIGVGLIDETWLEKVPAELAPRLKQILDDPEG
jgi:hypothetical protein